MSQPCLTLVLPTYELHFKFAQALLESVARHATDPDQLAVILVVEAHNQPFVNAMAARFPTLRIASHTTERIMAELSIDGDAAGLLKRMGKFSFQSIKKIGAVLAAPTDWVLVMDSESSFLRPFSVQRLLDDYRGRKYVFYTRVADRGPGWHGSLSAKVTASAVALVGGTEDAWFLEYYHWFYERSVWQEILRLIKANGGFDRWMRDTNQFDVFENVLYYHHVRRDPSYDFVDSLEAIGRYLPPPIASRAAQALAGGLQVVGLLEHVTSLLSIDELPQLDRLFAAYALPFIRVEPYTIDPRVIETVRAFPSICALVSSHRARIMNKRIAVCIAGEFRSLHDNIRAVRDFTAGVACDLFIHGWNAPSIPAIADALAPVGLAVEEPPDVAGLLARIGRPEPGAKPGRDAGTLRMFHAISASIGLLADRADDYDIVVRMRPDAVFADSLRDLLVLIADDETFDQDTIYVPDRFHSQGINDQFAIGSTAAMRRYGQIVDFVSRGIEREYFNPEHLMARHLLAERFHLRTLPMRYLLLRAEPADLGRFGAMLAAQDATWWSARLAGPDHVWGATSLFAEKAKAMAWMQETGRFGDWSVLVGSEHLVPQQAASWHKPVVKLDIKRDYKNPIVTLSADPATLADRSALFVDLRPDGIALVSEPPPGTLLVQKGEGVQDIRLVRFDVDLSRPAAVRAMPSHDPARLPEDSYLQTRQTIAAVAPDDAGTSVMQRFLLAQAAENVGWWRSVRADLALWRGRRSRRRGDLLGARRLYARLLGLDPGRTREWVQYGHVLKDMGHLREALAAYEMALALRPTDADALLFRQTTQQMVVKT